MEESKSLLVGRDLTNEEMNELRRERMDRRIASGDFSFKNDPPWTPPEARWHAHEFIAHNEPGNLVRMLAEAYLELQDAYKRIGEDK